MALSCAGRRFQYLGGGGGSAATAVCWDPPRGVSGRPRGSAGTRCSDTPGPHWEQQGGSQAVCALPASLSAWRRTAKERGSLGPSRTAPRAQDSGRRHGAGSLCAEEARPAGCGLLLTDGVTVREAENAFHLVEGHMLLNLHHVLVEGWGRPAETTRIRPQAQGLQSRSEPQAVKPVGATPAGFTDVGGRRPTATAGTARPARQVCLRRGSRPVRVHAGVGSPGDSRLQAKEART